MRTLQTSATSHMASAATNTTTASTDTIKEPRNKTFEIYRWVNLLHEY